MGTIKWLASCETGTWLLGTAMAVFGRWPEERLPARTAFAPPYLCTHTVSVRCDETRPRKEPPC